MNWRVKAAAQTVLSALPWGEKCHYRLQRHVTGTLPVEEDTLLLKVDRAEAHIESFRRGTDDRIHPADASFFEFGAGWDLITALSFSCFGVRHQTVTDLYPIARPELVNNAIRRLRLIVASGGNDRFDPSVLDVVPEEAGPVSRLEKDIGIRYLAPVSPSKTGFPARSFDFISSTDTLEHLPADQVGPVLLECFRILKPGGILSCQIDYRDHYAYAGRTTSIYNFLRFSEREWRKYNPPLHYQNRLRHRDYLSLIEKTPFEILSHGTAEPTGNEIGAVHSVPVHAIFRENYKMDELAVAESHLVLRK